MVSLEIIEREINELEHRRDTTYAVCERLSWLYIVRDHLMQAETRTIEGTSQISALSGSEFLDAANGKPYEDVMKVVDEHLETIRMLYPKTYDGLVQRVREL